RPDARTVRAEFLQAVDADPAAAEPRAGQLTEAGAPGPTRAAAATAPAAVVAAVTDPAARLAAAYHRRLLHLAARDVTGAATVDEVAAELADLADAVL